MKNFYPDQYKKDKNFFTNHNYLSEQFSDNEIILNKIKEVVQNNDFTLGAIVDEVEEMIANEAGTKYAIGVGSGTDALFLSLKALGIGNGDEVITTTYTFYATIGAIVTSGANLFSVIALLITILTQLKLKVLLLKKLKLLCLFIGQEDHVIWT